MSDDATYFGTDTARYQPLGTYNPRAFEIVNRQDPQLYAKLARNRAERRPSGIYLWVYPGHDLAVDAVDMVDEARRATGADPALGYWADYEDAGIGEWQLHAFFAGLDARGARGGYYSGPFALDHRQFLDRDWWNAAYPTGGPDFPGYGSLWGSSRPRSMKLWQYTSWGSLDADVATENPWYETLVVQFTPPTPTPVPKEDDDMVQITLNGVDFHVWASGGRILYRAYRGGAPGKTTTVPPASGSEGAEVDMDNPRPLVIEGLGSTQLYFAEAHGRGELKVTDSGFGLQYQLI